MNRAEAISLAWSLNDSVKRSLPRRVHAALCAKIGAGEHDCAIRESLLFYAGHNAALPRNLAAPVIDWVTGYRGSESEKALGEAIAAIRVSAENEAEMSCAQPEQLANGNVSVYALMKLRGK